MCPTTPRRPRQDGCSSLSASGFFRTTLAQHRYLAATLPLDHDRQIKETEPCYPLAGCRPRSGGHRKASFECDTGSSCFWCRHYSSHYDQGKFHPPSRTGCPRLKHSQDKMANEQDCVDLGILCANVCDALRQGTGERRADELSESVRNAINRLET